MAHQPLARRESMRLDRLRQAWFGNDVFISYSRRDGAEYALALASELTKAGIVSFLDQWGTPPGTTLPEALRAAIRSSTMLVLIGTPGAASSANVRMEVEEFLKTGRSIVPVTFTGADSVPGFPGTLESADWYPLIQGISLTFETQSALYEARPSQQVLTRIVNAEGFTRRSLRLRRVFIATVAGILLLLATGGITLSVLLGRVDDARTSLAAAERAERAATASRLATSALGVASDYPQRAAVLAGQAGKLLLDAGDPLLPAVEEALRRCLANIGGKPVGSHSDAVVSVAFSANNLWLATASYDGSVRVWDRRSPSFPVKPLVFETGTDALFGAAISPDSRWLIAYGRRERAWVWPLDDPQAKPQMLKTTGDIQRAGFTPDSRWAVIAETTDPLRMWRLSPQMTEGQPVLVGGESMDQALARKIREYEATSMSRPKSTSFEEFWLSVMVQTAHTPDFRWSASMAAGRAPSLHDLTSSDPREPVAVLAGYSERLLHRIAVSRTGEWVAALSSDEAQTIHLWRIGPKTASKPFKLSGHTGKVSVLDFSPDGRWLVSGGADQTVRVWDLAHAAPLVAPTVLQGHPGGVHAIAFSPDGHWLATGSDSLNGSTGYDNKAPLQLWDLRATAPLSSTRANPARSMAGLPVNSAIRAGRISRLSFSGDGKWLAAYWEDSANPGADQNRSVQLWDVSREPDGRMFSNRLPFVLRSHEAQVRAEAFCPDSRCLATVADDHAVRLWDLESGQFMATPFHFAADDTIESVLGSPDDRWLAARTTSGLATLVDLSATGHPRAWRVGPIRHERILVAMSANGRRLVAAGKTKGQASDVFVHDLTTHEGSPPVTLTDIPPLEEVTLSGDGRFFFVRTSNGQLGAWVFGNPSEALTPVTLSSAAKSVDALSTSPDGRWLATSSRTDGTVNLWPLTDPARLEAVQLEGHGTGVSAMAFSPDARWLASAGLNREIRIWDLRSPRVSTVRHVVADAKFVPTTVQFSSDGRWLTSFSTQVLSYHPEVLLTDLAAPETPPRTLVLKTWKGVGGFELKTAIVSPNARWLLTSSYEGSQSLTTMLWDLSAPNFVAERRVLSTGASAEHAAFSPDGRWLATGDQMWDLTKPEPVVTTVPILGGNVNPSIHSVRFSRDQRWLIVAVDDRLSLHSLRHEELVTKALAAAGRRLTTSEWRTFFPGVAYPTVETK